MKIFRMVSPNTRALVALMFLSGICTSINAKAADSFDFSRDCTSKNLDAALDKNAYGSDAASSGNSCIQYISTYLDGFEAGSLIAENYLTSYMADKIVKIEGIDLDKMKGVTPLQEAVISSTKNTPYKLCIPKGTSNAEIARVVVDYLDEKPYARKMPNPQNQILDALWEKYQNLDTSCRVPQS